MADETNENHEDPNVRDERRDEPETGSASDSQGADADDSSAQGGGAAEDAAPADPADVPEEGAEGLSEADEAILDEAQRDLVAEMRNDMLRAQAELVNFRTRVERDRQANREAVIAEVIRSLLPAIDDLDRAEKHGDLVEGSALAIVAQKIRGGFEKYGLRAVGEKGEAFDPNLHEALVQLPMPGVESNTVHDVVETGYALGDRLIRAAKVAVAVPADGDN